MKSESRHYLEFIGRDKYVEPTGFWKNLHAAASQVVREDWSISRWINDNPIADSKKRVMDAYYSGTITDEDMASNSDGSSLGWDNIIRRANKKYNLNIETLESAKGRLRDDLKAKREETQDVHSRATGAGVAGRFVGMFGAYAVDPVALPTYFMGIGAAAKGAQFLKALSVVAAGEAVAETVIQTSVYNWKNTIGVDYSVKDAALSIIAVTGGSAALGSVGYGIRGMLRKARATTVNATRLKRNLDVVELKRRGEEYKNAVEGGQFSANKNFADYEVEKYGVAATIETPGKYKYTAEMEEELKAPRIIPNENIKRTLGEPTVEGEPKKTADGKPEAEAEPVIETGTEFDVDIQDSKIAMNQIDEFIDLCGVGV